MMRKSAWYRHWDRLEALLGTEKTQELREEMQRDNHRDYLRKERKRRLRRVAQLEQYTDPLSPLLSAALKRHRDWLASHPEDFDDS